MNLQKGNITLLAAVLLAALVIAPLVMANIGRFTATNVIVHNITGGPNYNAVQIGDANGNVLSCADTDGGFNPTQKGDLNANFSDRNGVFNYHDRCLDANTLLEFACGMDVNVNGGMAQTNSAYAFKFNCADLNKVCSAGACV